MGTLVTSIPRTVDDLLRSLDSGKLGLPDLQRPYVWPDTKVRDLLDSMVKGYPIGFVMTWNCPRSVAENEGKTVGTNDKIYSIPNELVIDGQQRLTGLLSALKGVEVIDKNYNSKVVGVAYNPLTNEFKEPNGPRRNNPEWIVGLETIFNREKGRELSDIREDYFDEVNESRKKRRQSELSRDEKRTVEKNLLNLDKLTEYQIPTLSISDEADLDVVSTIFCRTNSGGQKLNQNDFIETLLSVYSNVDRNRIEDFCRNTRIPGTSVYNTIFQPERNHIVRIAYAYGFNRAVLTYAVKLLSGEDLQNRTKSDKKRDENHQIFREALDIVLDPNNWNNFKDLIMKTGIFNQDMITSKNALAFSYNLFLIGKYRFKMSLTELTSIISKWIFMATATSMYSGSFETKVEARLKKINEKKTKEEFVGYLQSVINENAEDKFFNVTLPGEFNKTSTNSPAWNTYTISKILAQKPVFYGNTLLSAFFLQKKGDGLHVHHIFPKNYLYQIGYDENLANANANKVYIQKLPNINISDKPPKEYIGEYREKYGEKKYKQLCQDHDLPYGFETMEYREFLLERSKLMSKSIKEAFESIE